MKKISRNLALFLLRYDVINNKKAIIMCKGFANDDNDFLEVISEDYESLKEDDQYVDFEIWIKEKAGQD